MDEKAVEEDEEQEESAAAISVRVRMIMCDEMNMKGIKRRPRGDRGGGRRVCITIKWLTSG